MAATYASAIQLDLLEPGIRTLLVGESVGNEALLMMLPPTLDLRLIRSGARLMDQAAMWPHVEKLQSVNVRGNFVTDYELHELVVKSRKLRPGLGGPSLLFPSEEYLDSAASHLEKVGLPRGEWFVAFQFAKDDFRSTRPATFIKALQEIVDTGGYVVHFGTREGFHDLIDSPRYINLTLDGHRHAYAHPYLITQARFLLTNISGPQHVATVAGTDVIVCDAVAIGRNTVSSVANAVYLPRVPVDSHGRPVTLSKLLTSPMAYAECGTQAEFMKRFGFGLRETSSDEILRTVRTQLAISDSPSSHTGDSDIQEKINRIREEAGAVSYGPIADAFLDIYPWWCDT